MPLTLVTGRANSGKTGVLYDALRDAAGDGRPAVLLLPGRADVARAERELAEEVPTGLRVVGLDRYVASLWPACGDPRRIATSAQRRAILSAAVEESGIAEIWREPSQRVLATVIAASAGSGWSIEGEDGEIRDVVSCIRGYRRMLDDADLVEPAEAVRIAGSSAPASPGLLLVAHRFVSLSPVQERFLCRRSAAGEEVMVSLVYEDGLVATEATKRLLERLSAGVPEVVIRPCRSTGPYSPSAELRKLETGLFGSTEESGHAADVGLRQGPGADGEAACVVDAVLESLQRGVPADHIAVVTRQPSGHGRRLARALTSAGVACEVDAPIAAHATAVGRALIRLGDAVRVGRREDLAAFLRTPYSGLAPEAMDRLDAGWRARRTTDAGEMLADVRRESTEAAGLVDLAAVLRSTDDAVGIARELVSSMCANAHGRSAPRLDGAARLDARTCEAFVSVVADTVGLRSGADPFASVASVTVSPPGAEARGHVRILDADRARSRRFDVVVVTGLEPGGFPRVAEPSAAERLADRLGVEPMRRSGPEQERLLFYQVVTRARRRLILTRRSEDEKGAPLPPSPFWEEVADPFRWEGAGTRPCPSRPDGPRPPVGIRGSSSERLGLSGEMRSSLAEREVFSAGELETYLSCPHAWLHAYVLSPRSLDREIDKAEAGRLLHRALKETYECLPDRLGVSRLGPAGLPSAYALLDEILERLLERAPEPHDLIETEELRGVRRIARASLARDACSLTGFSPLHLEWSFGMGDGDGPEDLGGFFLRGRVDRIDRSGDGIIVIDYKSSGGPRFDRFAEDGLLQLPLYGLVAARRLGLPLLGGLYRNVKEDRTRGFFIEDAVPDPGPGSGRSRLDAATRDDVIADAVERARCAVEGIRSGRIEPVTQPVDRCGYCRAASACGAGRS